MAPPRAKDFTFEMLGHFDDEALRTFLDPRQSGVGGAELAQACWGAPRSLTERIRSTLPAELVNAFDGVVASEPHAELVRQSRESIIEKLFWPLVYWNDPDEYDELVAGETIHPDVLATLDLAGRLVCDIGAGAGRFTLYAAPRATSVIAVDAAPGLLELLMRKASHAAVDNISPRRGSFSSLPVDDASVDVAVACSSFTNQGSDRGEQALREAERIVRPGGQVAVIWPQEPRWFQERGYGYECFSGNDLMHFRDAATAERLCSRYYSEAAAEWVREHHSAEVPFWVLGTRPPNDVCIKRIS